MDSLQVSSVSTADYTVNKIAIVPCPSNPFHILATRYTSNVPTRHNDDTGYTLIFLHAVGMHKETWEVTIGRLFALSRRGHNACINEMYSIENPNHGESAVLNEAIIQQYYPEDWPTREYARVAHLFLTAGPSTGAQVDFSRRRLVGIGHSIGAAALFLMSDLSPKVKFESVIAFEAGLAVKDFPETLQTGLMLTSWTWLRQDVWPNRKVARKQLTSSPAFKNWDSRVLELYVRYGLREHPAAKYAPPYTFNGVTTSLSKVQEAATYRSEHLVVDAVETYTKLSREVPVHLVWGRIHDHNVMSPGLQRLLSDPLTGRTPASVNYVEGAGHLVVQQKPDCVAKVLHSILSQPRAYL